MTEITGGIASLLNLTGRRPGRPVVASHMGTYMTGSQVVVEGGVLLA